MRVQSRNVSQLCRHNAFYRRFKEARQLAQKYEYYEKQAIAESKFHS